MSGFIGGMCILFLIAGLVWLACEGMGGLIMIMLSLFGMYTCSTNPTLITQRAEQARQGAEDDKKCQVPYFVSAAGGVSLFAYKPHCNSGERDIVYFSKSGTQSTECHPEGKRQVCKPRFVPNGEAK